MLYKNIKTIEFDINPKKPLISKEEQKIRKRLEKL